MNDLVARAKKYSRGAGRTQEGQYLGAKRDERRSTWLGWASAAISAAVGTSIFAHSEPEHPIILGMAAILAATLSTVQHTAKFSERADAHRSSGAEYGRLRRRLDMLRLRMEGGDITREKALIELDKIGERMSDLARQARVLPEAIYDRAKEKFDMEHQEYSDQERSTGKDQR